MLLWRHMHKGLLIAWVEDVYLVDMSKSYRVTGWDALRQVSIHKTTGFEILGFDVVYGVKSVRT